MLGGKSLLLVEGIDDKSFFEELFKILRLSSNISPEILIPPYDENEIYKALFLEMLEKLNIQPNILSEILGLLPEKVENYKVLFEELFKKLTLSDIFPQILIAPPKEIGGKANTKQGVFNYLPIALKQLSDGDLTHLGVVVDADYQTVNPPDGYANTLKKVTEIINPYGFNLKNSMNGFIFEHNDGLSDLGLWIMPNNQREGMLEDFIKICLHTNEQSLFSHVERTIDNLDNPRFKPHHKSKAEIATWLAWQKKIEYGLYCSLPLLDENNALFQELKHWLNHIYNTEN